MSTDSNGIPTYAELRSKYADAYGSSPQFKVTIPNTTQCPTAGWIKDNVDSPGYVWSYASNYSNDNQLPKCGHIFTSSNDYIVRNPTPFQVRHNWSVTSYPSASTVYSGFSMVLYPEVSGGGSVAEFLLSQDAGNISNVSISGNKSYYLDVGSGWGASGMSSGTITITAMCTNASYGMYGETKTSSFTYSASSSQGKILLINGSFQYNSNTGKFSFATFSAQWGS